MKTAQASFAQIRRAASALILQCVASGTGESTGGIASNIGRQDLTEPVVIPFHIAAAVYSCPKRGARLTSMSVGGDNQLRVVLSTYQPNVQCRGTIGPEWNSCKDILGDMPAGKPRITFGPRADKSVQQGLPVIYNSGEKL